MSFPNRARRSSLGLLAALLFLPLLSTAQAKELRYFVDLRDTKDHVVHVKLKPVGYTAKTATFQMPVWAPGAYSVTHYGKYVENIQATDAKGKSLAITKLNDDRWSVADAKSLAEIRYDVRDSHKDSTSLYFAMANMDTSFFFANATALYGYVNDDKKSPATIVYDKPLDWQLITPLPPSKKGFSQDTTPTFKDVVFYAENYDVLADAPVMASPMLATKSFRVGSAVYDLAIGGDKLFSSEKLDSLTFYLRKIVAAETDFFHDTPFKRYSFLVYAPSFSHMPSLAQGALEHANSSDYLLINAGWKLFKTGFLNIFSHEFFHLWDVKRIHSNKLGPFDYTQRVKTTSLWMAEGVTDYYAHTLMTRYDIFPAESYYNDIQQWLEQMRRRPAASQTLEDLSIAESDFDLENAELFYIKGPLVAMMLDIEIRDRTNNAKSLDDVMHGLNAEAKKGKTFSDEELIHRVEHYAGIDLSSFYTKYIHGADSLPLDDYLGKMGIRLAKKSGQGATMSLSEDGKLLFQNVDASSALYRAGVRPGDVLLTVNGEAMSLENIDDFVNLRDNASSAAITVRRAGEEQSMTVSFDKGSANVKRVGGIEIELNPTPKQLAIRKGIIGDKA